MTTDEIARTAGQSGLSTADRLEIAELPARFCHHSDYGEYEQFADLFADDVVTELVGVGTYVGLDAQIRHARDTDTWTSGHAWHVVTNLWIEATPNGAAVHYYLLGMLRTGSADSGQVNTTGRMVDHVVRTRDGWRIQRRELTMDRPTTPPDLV
ncbi:nuclear transport factor 2 family protein [Streptomycetaceae bacterium NBC_01309]